MEELIEFLIEAKRQTYANQNIEKAESSRLGSNDYNYEDGDMVYHDTYFGGTKFMGEEVIYREGNPVWGMNYYGVTIDENESEEAMDDALRPALMRVGRDMEVIPVRGPSEFVNGEYTYKFRTEGNIENFIGIEEIYKGDRLIYTLNCCGGVIE